jgi:hypothetical protein
LAADEQIGNAHRITRVKGRTLGHIADFRLFTPLSGGVESDDSIVFLMTKNCFQKGALSCAVGANECYQIATMYMEVHTGQDLVVADGNTHVAYPQAAGITAGAAV